MCTKGNILNKVKRWALHRQRMMLHYGAFKNVDRMKAVSKILRHADFYKNSSFQAQCNIVNALREDLELIAPGKSSRSYEHDTKMLDKLFNLVNQNMEVQS